MSLKALGCASLFSSIALVFARTYCPDCLDAVQDRTREAPSCDTIE